jgi:hypothetical protein
MPKKREYWIESRGISIRKAANDLGFEIEHLEKFEKKQQKRFRKQIVNSIIRELDEDWEEARDARSLLGFPEQLRDVKKGVYVLCLDDRLCVSYKKKLSRVLYIGKGAIRQRINGHLQQKLLDFFLELPGIKFRFYMKQAKRTNSPKFFAHYEGHLLAEFEAIYGEKSLFNKNAGQRGGKKPNKIGWKLPLKNVKADYKWAISSVVSRQGSPELAS